MSAGRVLPTLRCRGLSLTHAAPSHRTESSSATHCCFRCHAEACQRATSDHVARSRCRVAADMVAGRATPPGPAPPDLLGRQLSLFPPVLIDSVPSGGLAS